MRNGILILAYRILLQAIMLAFIVISLVHWAQDDLLLSALAIGVSACLFMATRKHWP